MPGKKVVWIPPKWLLITLQVLFWLAQVGTLFAFGFSVSLWYQGDLSVDSLMAYANSIL